MLLWQVGGQLVADSLQPRLVKTDGPMYWRFLQRWAGHRPESEGHFPVPTAPHSYLLFSAAVIRGTDRESADRASHAYQHASVTDIQIPQITLQYRVLRIAGGLTTSREDLLAGYDNPMVIAPSKRSVDLGYYPLGRTKLIEFKQPGGLYRFTAICTQICTGRSLSRRATSMPNRTSTGRILMPGTFQPGITSIVAWHVSRGFFP